MCFFKFSIFIWNHLRKILTIHLNVSTGKSCLVGVKIACKFFMLIPLVCFGCLTICYGCFSIIILYNIISEGNKLLYVDAEMHVMSV